MTASLMNTHVRDNLLQTAPALVTTNGDLVYATGASALTRLAIGSTSQVLIVTGGVPAWGAGSVVTLLKANSGTSTTTAAHNVDTVAISGLASGDSIFVVGMIDQITQDAGTFALRNDTDAITIVSVLNGINAGVVGIFTAHIMQSQQSTTAIETIFSRGNVVATGQSAATFTTAWTGSWTLAFRSPGQISGGTHRWRWSVYKFAAA